MKLLETTQKFAELNLRLGMANGKVMGVGEAKTEKKSFGEN